MKNQREALKGIDQANTCPPICTAAAKLKNSINACSIVKTWITQAVISILLTVKAIKSCNNKQKSSK